MADGVDIDLCDNIEDEFSQLLQELCQQCLDLLRDCHQCHCIPGQNGPPGNRGPPPRIEPPMLGLPPTHLRDPPPIDTRGLPPLRPEWERAPVPAQPPPPGSLPPPNLPQVSGGPPPGHVMQPGHGPFYPLQLPGPPANVSVYR